MHLSSLTPSHGFTLMEVLLSLAIIGILTGISIPMYGGIQGRESLSSSVTSSVEMLRLAQSYARNGYYDDSWSVRFSSNSATLYKGSSYTSRNTTYDETISLATGTSVIGSPIDIHFQKLNGNPVSDISIQLQRNATQKNININSQGMVQY